MKSAPLQSSEHRLPLSTPNRAQGKPSRAVTSPTLSHPIIQARLRISSPNDRSEQEADQVADQVERMAAPEVEPASVPRQFTACMGSARCPNWVEEARRSPAEEEGEVQTKQESGRTPTVRPRIQAQIHSLRGGGQPLGPATRAFMEPRFGQDFGNVRIHQGSTAETAAASLQARAFTLGCDVVFAEGEHDPKSESGKRLLAHELAHVVQQRGSVRAGSIQREEGSGASLAPPFRRGLGMRAPYRLEIGDPRSDTSVHSSWYTLLPSIVGISMDAFTQRYPVVDDSWYKRLVELGLTVGWQVPWMVLSHEYGHYRVGEREGWDPDVSLTSWYSGVTEYTNRAAYAAAPESAQIEASAAGVNQERLNSMRMFIDWALNNSIDPTRRSLSSRRAPTWHSTRRVARSVVARVEKTTCLPTKVGRERARRRS